MVLFRTEYGGYITEIRLEHTFYTDLPASTFIASGSVNTQRFPVPDDSSSFEDFYNFRPQTTRTTESPAPDFSNFQPDNTYQPKPSFQPQPSFPPQPSFQPQPSYQPQPVHRPETTAPPSVRPTQAIAQPQSIPSDTLPLPIDISPDGPVAPSVSNTLYVMVTPTLPIDQHSIQTIKSARSSSAESSLSFSTSHAISFNPLQSKLPPGYGHHNFATPALPTIPNNIPLDHKTEFSTSASTATTASSTTSYTSHVGAVLVSVSTSDFRLDSASSSFSYSPRSYTSTFTSTFSTSFTSATTYFG